MLITLAWRNIFRQKKRTLISACAIALTLTLSLILRSFQEGTYTNSIKSTIEVEVGAFQIQPNYDGVLQSINDTLTLNHQIIKQLPTLDNILAVYPKIENGALISSDSHSRGIHVVAFDSNLEKDINKLPSKIRQGDYFDNTSPQIILGQGLAKYLNINVGDDVVLYGQGYRGQIASGLFKVQGLFNNPIHEVNNYVVYMDLNEAQRFYSLDDQISFFAVDVSDLNGLESSIQAATDFLASYYSDIKIKDWIELQPEIHQQIIVDLAFGEILVHILYGIVGFSLFSTLVMMTLERQREFSVMLATGLFRHQLVLLILIESILMTTLGITIGLVIATPILLYFYFNPITYGGESAQAVINMGWEPKLPIQVDLALISQQFTILIGLIILCSLYPVWRALSLNIINGLKGGK